MESESIQSSGNGGSKWKGKAKVKVVSAALLPLLLSHLRDLRPDRIGPVGRMPPAVESCLESRYDILAVLLRPLFTPKGTLKSPRSTLEESQWNRKLYVSSQKSQKPQQTLFSSWASCTISRGMLQNIWNRSRCSPLNMPREYFCSR